MTTAVTETRDERQAILHALDRWIRQRPGLEWANYAGSNYRESLSNYRSELRSITKDLHHARELLKAVGWRTSIDAEALKDALKHAYSGRLSWDGKELSYCTGQYWPTEYRRAVCAVLASALWAHARSSGVGNGSERPGDDLRAYFRKEFGRSIASRWFS